MKTLPSFFFTIIALCGTAAWLVFSEARAFAQDPPTAAAASNTAGPIQKADTEWDGMVAEITSVKRGDGDTITIQFKYTNTGSKKAEIGYSELGAASASHVVYYIDPKNKKKYTVIKDAADQPVASNMTHIQLDPGASRSGWTKLPAPPADVTKITVYIPGAPPFESVPLAP